MYGVVAASGLTRPLADRVLTSAAVFAARRVRVPAPAHPETVLPDGPLLVFVPHPDDESLGCGGFIARATSAGRRVRIVFVTDGSASHPDSKQTPPAALARIREHEATLAAGTLGVPAIDVVFLRAPDGNVPSDASDPRTAVHLDRIREQFVQTGARTFFAPWRRDPHPDHRAVAQLCATAARELPYEITRYEYVVWLGEYDDDANLPRADEGREIAFDVREVLGRKARAVLCHRSQRGLVVRDAPNGFALPMTLIYRSLRCDERFVVSTSTPG